MAAQRHPLLAKTWPCRSQPVWPAVGPLTGQRAKDPFIRLSLVVCAGLFGGLLAQEALAANPTPGMQLAAPPASTSKAGHWQRLSPAEQVALAPLAGNWDQLSAVHRKKWQEISRSFPALQPAEQAKMHERMREWAALSAEERARARLNFGKTVEIARELSPAEKLAKWQAYQALSPEQRGKLAEQARTRTLGAAPAAQPVSPQKLAVLPPPVSARSAKAAESTEESTAAETGGSQ